jgi:hypothetical protein
MRRLISCIPCVLLLGLLALSFGSCREEGFDRDPGLRLSFSADTLIFDTVFTTIGSSTRSFMVYNRHNRRVNISSIRLAGQEASFFRINADGASGRTLHDIEIGAGDSLFVFVEVTIDPVNQQLPLIITDSVVFHMNNNIQDVKLVAWGQDAHFIHPNYQLPGSDFSYHLIDEDTHWTAELPYVIYGLAVIAPDISLHMEAGARVHFHNNSSMVFLGGSSLKINGTAEDPVHIQGDRLESFYREIPGQWGRIWFTATSMGHEINYAIIKNGTVGLHIDSIGSLTAPSLIVRNSIIKNMSMAGLLAQGSHVRAENLLVANCGEHALVLALGGNYHFNHCTFANYYNLPNHPARRTSSVVLNNYYEDAEGIVRLRPFENVFFGNSIIYGSLQNELYLDFFEGTQEDYTFDHCMIRSELDASGSGFINVMRNQDPLFNDIREQDYRLRENSPAIGMGNPDLSLQVPFDLLGNSRALRSDIGALQYYKIEEGE